MNFPAQAEATFHCFQEASDGFAVHRDLDVDTLLAITVDNGEGLTAFVVYVLSNIEGTLMTLWAECTAVAMDFVWASTLGAMRSMTSECFHHVKLVIMGKARVGGDGSEIDLAGSRRHGGL